MNFSIRSLSSKGKLILKLKFPFLLETLRKTVPDSPKTADLGLPSVSVLTISILLLITCIYVEFLISKLQVLLILHLITEYPEAQTAHVGDSGCVPFPDS